MKVRSPKPAFKLPINFQNASAALDRDLDTISALCLGLGNAEEADVEMVNGIGTAISNYLRRRSALETVLGRTPLYCDDEFTALVRDYRRRLRVKG